MPLFEVDAQRPVLVKPTPAGGSLATAAQRVVDGNLDGLLGEQIFPVAHGHSPQEPHLLALDAAGLPVVIDVVEELTEETLTRALNHAGAAGRLTRAQLAARYGRGPQAFHRDVGEFYEHVPMASGVRRSDGARLIMICQRASRDVLDAVDFLRQPGSPVAVLQLNVVRSQDGRRYVDVSPIAMSQDHPVVGAAQKPLAGSPDFIQGVAVGRALTGKVPVVSRPHQPPPSVSAPPPSPSMSIPQVQSDGQVTAAAEPAYAREAQPSGLPSAPMLTRAQRRRSQIAETSSASIPMVPQWPGDPQSVVGSPELPILATRENPQVPAAASPSPEVIRPDLSGEGLSDDDPDLIALAADLGVPSKLVWSRPRRGQRFDALLMPDGYIVLTDGSKFRHPDLAAAAVSGVQTADGWSVWRFGEDGPSLTDAFRARHRHQG